MYSQAGKAILTGVGAMEIPYGIIRPCPAFAQWIIFSSVTWLWI